LIGNIEQCGQGAAPQETHQTCSLLEQTIHSPRQ
jgi:hypothetical protein